MSYSKSIGGYFELELSDLSMYRDNVVLLNSARACLEIIILHTKIQKIYLPRYTCDVILEPLKKHSIKYEYYDINNQLEIVQDIFVKDNECLLYTNYYGLKDNYCKQLSVQYDDRLILDCSQAYYFKYFKKSHIIYSPRKFFGVPDGGELYTNIAIDNSFDTDISYNKFSHLLKRIDVSPEYGFEDFKKNDNKIGGSPIKNMSNLTKRILKSINYDSIKAERIKNYNHLHAILGKKNEFNLILTADEVPMVYPYLKNGNNALKDRLISKRIFVATYWSNVYKWALPGSYEYYLVDNMLALPIDQRYNIMDMDRLAEVIDE